MYHNFLAILKDGGFKTARVKKKIEKNILECILYIELNKKIPYKIVQKLISRTVQSFFLNKLIINKN